MLLAIALVSALSPGSAQAAMYKDIPADHWSYPAIYSVMKAVGFEVYPDYSPRYCITRFEMAMQLARVYGELDKSWIRDRFTQDNSRTLLALTAEYADELSFLVAYCKGVFTIRDNLIWLANERTLVVPSAVDLTRHSLFQDVTADSWVYPTIERFVRAGYFEGYPGYYDGYFVRPPRTFTRYEFGLLTERLFRKLAEDGRFHELSDADILRLLALSSEFALEMDELGFDCRPVMLALLFAKPFLPGSQDSK